MRKPPGYDQLPNSVLTALDAFRQGRYRSDLNALRALASNPDWAWTKGQIHTWITDSELPSNVKTPQRYYKIIHADGFLATHGLITNSKKRGRGGKLANHAQITADGLSLLEMMDEHIARGVLAADQPWSMNNTLASIATELMDTPLREWRNGLLWRVMHVVGETPKEDAPEDQLGALAKVLKEDRSAIAFALNTLLGQQRLVMVKGWLYLAEDNGLANSGRLPLDKKFISGPRSKMWVLPSDVSGYIKTAELRATPRKGFVTP